MDKIWTSAKVKIRNRLDFIHYGQRIGYINIVAIVIDLAFCSIRPSTTKR